MSRETSSSSLGSVMPDRIGTRTIAEGGGEWAGRDVSAVWDETLERERKEWEHERGEMQRELQELRAKVVVVEEEPKENPQSNGDHAASTELGEIPAGREAEEGGQNGESEEKRGAENGRGGSQGLDEYRER
eukprot:49361-Rhodomonas_salina.1